MYEAWKAHFLAQDRTEPRDGVVTINQQGNGIKIISPAQQEIEQAKDKLKSFKKKSQSRKSSRTVNRAKKKKSVSKKFVSKKSVSKKKKKSVKRASFKRKL